MQHIVPVAPANRTGEDQDEAFLNSEIEQPFDSVASIPSAQKRSSRVPISLRSGDNQMLGGI